MAVGIKQAIVASEASITDPEADFLRLAPLDGEGYVYRDENSNLYFIDGWRKFTAQTTDATPTNVSGAEVLLSEGQVVLVKARIEARIADLSAGLIAELTVGARRATGGNVTLLGSVDSILIEDSASAPTVTLVADTTAQAVDVQITGVAAETWNWKIRLYGIPY